MGPRLYRVLGSVKRHFNQFKSQLGLYEILFGSIHKCRSDCRQGHCWWSTWGSRVPEWEVQVMQAMLIRSQWCRAQILDLESQSSAWLNMVKWPLHARLCVWPLCTLQKSFGWDYKLRSPVCIHMQKDQHAHVKDPVVHMRIWWITIKKIKKTCTESVSETYTHAKDHMHMLKILWSTWEFGGLQKPKIT